MIDLTIPRTAMPEQPADLRACNFDEVALGYTAEMAMVEAKRCLNCKNRPCVSGCPVNVAIPDFIAKVANGDFEGAYRVITATSSLPAICGRVCPQEMQCERNCVRGIKGESVAIGRLERFVADYAIEHNLCREADNIGCKAAKVAVIGSGPAGLTCAGDLAAMGYKVTVFEAFHTAGGVLMYGIPQFRLPKSIVQREVDNLRRMGVEFMTNMVIGKVLTVDELFEMGYGAVFIGTGAGLPNFMGIEGESLCGVFSANEFLTRINLMKAYLDGYDTPTVRPKRVAVIGGGNVAMDAARTSKRLGAEVVYIVYRRSDEEMPARREEIEHAKEEGIKFLMLTNITKIHGDEQGRVNGITCERMELGEPDESGRRRPVAVSGSDFDVDVDTVIMAIGNSPNKMVSSTCSGLVCNRRGGIEVNDDMSTSVDGVFAGGDAVTGAATVILAMGAGKKAAAAIDKYLSK